MAIRSPAKGQLLVRCSTHILADLSCTTAVGKVNREGNQHGDLLRVLHPLKTVQPSAFGSGLCPGAGHTDLETVCHIPSLSHNVLDAAAAVVLVCISLGFGHEDADGPSPILINQIVSTTPVVSQGENLGCLNQMGFDSGVDHRPHSIPIQKGMPVGPSSVTPLRVYDALPHPRSRISQDPGFVGPGLPCGCTTFRSRLVNLPGGALPVDSSLVQNHPGLWPLDSHIQLPHPAVFLRQSTALPGCCGPVTRRPSSFGGVENEFVSQIFTAGLVPDMLAAYTVLLALRIKDIAKSQFSPAVTGFSDDTGAIGHPIRACSTIYFLVGGIRRQICRLGLVVVEHDHHQGNVILVACILVSKFVQTVLGLIPEWVAGSVGHPAVAEGSVGHLAAPVIHPKLVNSHTDPVKDTLGSPIASNHSHAGYPTVALS